VKELLKSVHICQSYRKNKSGTFFVAHGLYNYLMCISSTKSGKREGKQVLFNNKLIMHCLLIFLNARIVNISLQSQQ